MVNSKIIFEDIQAALKLDDREEVRAIAFALMEKYYHVTLTDILSKKEVEFQNLASIIARLNQHEPLQYVFGEAEFFNRKFKVNPAVLIPRPETELLIQEVLRIEMPTPRILDVGTGSGCIAITLNLEIPNSKVYAIDVSQNALDTALENANRLGAPIAFICADFLNDNFDIAPVDLLVSNPPYILENEKKSMPLNVLNFEPHQALFVPDNHPLLFFKAIAEKSEKILKPQGRIVVEINEHLGTEVKNLFESFGLKAVKIVPDLDRKNRIVIALKDGS